MSWSLGFVLEQGWDTSFPLGPLEADVDPGAAEETQTCRKESVSVSPPPF